MKRQLATLGEQGPEHRHKYWIVVDWLLGLGVDIEAIGVQPRWSADYLIGPCGIGTHDVRLDGSIVDCVLPFTGLAPPKVRSTDRGASVDGSDFKARCRGGLRV